MASTKFFSADRFIFVNLLLFASLLGTLAFGEEKAAIRFQPLAQAVEKGGEEKRVVVVYLTAAWCGYCRKMENIAFADQEVQSLARKFVWAKVDIDKEPHHAAMFGVRGVPAFAFLNTRGELLEMQSGYHGPGRFVDLLKKNVGKAEARRTRRLNLQRLEKATGKLKDAVTDLETDAAVLEVVLLLASPVRQKQEQAKKAIFDAGRAAWPVLVARLSDERLAVRAAVYDVLTEAIGAEGIRSVEATGRRLAYDAFAAKPTRLQQAAAWRKWLKEERPKNKR